jgi:hypothetical protein
MSLSCQEITRSGETPKPRMRAWKLAHPASFKVGSREGAARFGRLRCAWN